LRRDEAEFETDQTLEKLKTIRGDNRLNSGLMIAGAVILLAVIVKG